MDWGQIEYRNLSSQKAETRCLSASSRRDVALLVCNSQLIKALTKRQESSVIYSVTRYSELYFQKKCLTPQQLLILGRSEPGYSAPLQLKIGHYAEKNLGFTGLQKTNRGDSTPAHLHLLRSGEMHDLGELIFFLRFICQASAVTTYIYEMGNEYQVYCLSLEFCGFFFNMVSILRFTSSSNFFMYIHCSLNRLKFLRLFNCITTQAVQQVFWVPGNSLVRNFCANGIKAMPVLLDMTFSFFRKCNCKAMSQKSYVRHILQDAISHVRRICTVHNTEKCPMHLLQCQVRTPL